MKHPILYAALSVLLLTGCVRSDVTRFHNLPKWGGGKTILIVPSDPAHNGSIEFNTYAQIVAGYFQKNGYVVVPPNAPNKDFIAVFTYSMGQGQTGVRSTPVYGKTGGGTTTYYTNYYGGYAGSSYTPPTRGVVGSRTFSYTTYETMVRVDIFDAKKSTKDRPFKVFEGVAKSHDSGGQLSVVMPAMIGALFTNFPGESGKTERFRGDKNY